MDYVVHIDTENGTKKFGFQTFKEAADFIVYMHRISRGQYVGYIA